MKLVKVKRTDTNAIWDVTEAYYEEYKSILEYIETWDSDTGEVFEHVARTKKVKPVVEVVEVPEVVEVKEVAPLKVIIKGKK